MNSCFSLCSKGTQAASRKVNKSRKLVSNFNSEFFPDGQSKTIFYENFHKPTSKAQ